MVQSSHILPKEHPVVSLNCTTIFNRLTSTEKKYAHFLSQAVWNRCLIFLIQTSLEISLIYSLLHRVFLSQSLSDFKKTSIEGSELMKNGFKALLVYTSGIVTNSGNCKGLGDTKFIPGQSQEKFEDFILNSKSCCDDSLGIRRAWRKVSEAMCSLKNYEKSLGFAGKGITTYLSENCTMNRITTENSLPVYNTRACKSFKNGAANYKLRLAYVSVTDQSETEEFMGAVFSIVHGDFFTHLEISQ